MKGKKLLTIVLTLCMLLSLLPVPALAVEGHVAMIGETGYPTLGAAIAAAQSGDTLTLLDDVALTTTFAIPAEMTLTIDGNGHKITPASGFTADGNGAALVLANGDTDYSANSKYTIKNLTFEGFTGLTRVVRANFCDAKIDNCFFLDNTVSEGVITSAYAKLTVNGCAFTDNTITDYAAIYVGGDVSTYTTHVANITGNSFTQNKAGVAVIYLTSSANVTGNYFYGNTHTGSNSNGATILAGPYNDEKEEGAYTINIMENAFVGTFVGTMGGKPAVYAEDWSAEYNANTAFDLSANYWNGEKPVEGVAYETSGSNPAIKLDSYYTTISEGTGELGDLKTHYAARIGDQEYATLAEAVNDANAAADAVTIELLENIELSAGLKINNTSQAAITINGKGHVISPADGATFTGLIVEVRTDVAIHDVVFENFTTSSDIIAAYNGADLTLNGCTFQNNTCRTVITCTSGYENAFAAVDCTFSNNTDTRGVIYNGSSGATATFSVADSTFTGNTTGGAGIVNVGGVAIITGNAFSNNMVDTTNSVAGVLYPWNIDVTVTNNSFSGNTVQVTHTEGKPIIAASAIVVKSGDTTNDLSGNTITADNTVQTRISADADWTIGDTAVYVRDTGEGVVSITSGTINGSITSTDAGISITGGTFSVDPSEYVASGYVVNTVSGKYVVSEQPPTSGGGSTPPTVTVPVSSDSGSANVSASISGTAVTVSITDQDLSQVIASAGNTGNVVIDVSGLNNVTSAVIPSKVITAVNGAEDATGLTVALPGGSVGLDSDALAAVAAAAGGADVTMSVETVDTSKLSESQQAVLGNQISNAIVVDVSIMAQGTAISSFDGGTVTISVPYEPEEGTDTSKLVVWYLADDGTISPVEGAYDPATKSFVFKTSHLSTYALVSFPFEDVTAGSWYYGNVAYVFNNNLFNGTSSSTFSPDDTMTRAMLMTVLARMAGQDTAVEDGVWYEKGMNWAVENGISDGTNPEGSITREQLVTMLYRYAGSPEASGDLSAFSDADKVDGYATLAMQWAVGKGLINGMGDGTLAPRDTATRAQVAAILMRFCENIIA